MTDGNIVYKPSYECKPSGYTPEELGTIWKCNRCDQNWIYCTAPGVPRSQPEWRKLTSRAARRFIRKARKNGHSYSAVKYAPRTYDDSFREPYDEY